MFLKKAEALHFRNYNHFSLDFDSSINIFVGENGQGKSSFLEALYCALRGKSFHPFVGSQFIQSQEKFSKICLTLEEREGLSKVESSFFRSSCRLKKELVYCGKKVRASSLTEKFPCFVFTESSLKSIRQGPAERRHFVEELFSFRRQNQARSAFEKVLKQKKQLLRNYKKGQVREEDFLRLLKVLNERFLIQSHLLVQARLELLNRIYTSVQKIRAHFFKEPLPFLDFSYLIGESEDLKRETDLLAILRKDLKRKEGHEIQAGIPLSGPQRHEIQFLFNGEDSRIFCSKGQQRSYILCLLLSHIQFFPQAFLLLDDVLLELDESIQKKLLQFLEKKNCQIFLTSCKITSFETKNMSFFNVARGKIKKL